MLTLKQLSASSYIGAEGNTWYNASFAIVDEAGAELATQSFSTNTSPSEEPGAALIAAQTIKGQANQWLDDYNVTYVAPVDTETPAAPVDFAAVLAQVLEADNGSI